MQKLELCVIANPQLLLTYKNGDFMWFGFNICFYSTC